MNELELSSSAFKEKDGFNWNDDPLTRVNEKGSPVERIDSVAYENDISSFWSMHLKKLWLIVVCCSIYLFFAII
jgi:hypothetical protein